MTIMVLADSAKVPSMQSDKQRMRRRNKKAEKEKKTESIIKRNENDPTPPYFPLMHLDSGE